MDNTRDHGSRRRNKKVLFVSSIFINLHHFRRGLMVRLRDLGYEVVAAAAFDSYEQPLQALGIRCVNLRNVERGGVNPLQELKFFLELCRLYRRERPAVVLHYTIKPNIYGSLAAALLGIKSVSTITGGGYTFLTRGLLPRLILGLYKLALGFPETVFFQNQDDRRTFVTARLVREAKTLLVPGSGVDVRYFSPAYCNETGNRPPVFLYIGRLLWDKGLRELVAAATVVRQTCPEAEFWLLGRVDPGNPAAVPEAVVRQWEAQGSVKWLGAVRDVRPQICASLAVVLPSYREGLPRSLLEAMAMGRPIITTDAIGCREVIEDGRNGYLVPVRDAQALAAACLKMLALRPEARQAMGAYGRQKAIREFDEELVIAAYLSVLEKLV